MSAECITQQIASNNDQLVIMIWFESNRDFMPFKYQYNSFQSYVFQRLDLIFSTYKSGWFDKLSLMSNSFHWRTQWGCCFFLILSIELIKTNWIELMVPELQCNHLSPAHPWNETNQVCRVIRHEKKSTRQRSYLPCLLLAHYPISIKFTNNNLAELAWKLLFEHK